MSGLFDAEVIANLFAQVVKQVLSLPPSLLLDIVSFKIYVEFQ